MALKDKEIRHNIDLLKNYIKNAFSLAGTEDESITNLKQLKDSFIYNTVKANSIKNIYSTVGGLTSGTDVSNKNIKELFDMMFFNTTGVEYVYPMVVNGVVNVYNNAEIIKTIPFGSYGEINEFLDYDGDVDIEIYFVYDKNDGGNITGVQINGTTLTPTVTQGNVYSIYTPIRTVIPSLDIQNKVSFGINYGQGEQKLDQQGNPSGTPIPAGVISFNNIVTFNKLSYPVFYKNFTTNENVITPTFNYHTDASGYLMNNELASVVGGGMLVIGIPNSFVDGFTILGKSLNVSDRFIRREINIASNNSGSIPYKLYYLFANADESDFTIGIGTDLSKLGTSDVFSWIGVDYSLTCVSQGVSNAAEYTLVEKLFGTQRTGYVITNTTQVPPTTSQECLISKNRKIKLADLSLIRYSTLSELYSSVGNIDVAESQFTAGITEPIIKNGDLVVSDNGQPVANKGYSLFKTGYGFAVLGINPDNTYTISQFPSASKGTEDWRVVTSSGTCERIMGVGTGYFVYGVLELYKNSITTGITKPNSISDKDYVAPKITETCLNIINVLGSGFDNSNKQYTALITCNNQLNTDKNDFISATKIDYVISGNNSLCYIRRGTDYELSGKAFAYYTMLNIGSYYKILQINPDSSWQLLYYTNNALAEVPTTWLGYAPTAACVYELGTLTGYLHYIDIYEVYTDNNFKIPVNVGQTSPNGTDGHTVFDVVSDNCKVKTLPATSITAELLAGEVLISIAWVNYIQKHGSRAVFLEIRELTIVDSVITKRKQIPLYWYTDDGDVTYKWDIPAVGTDRIFEIMINGFLD